MRGRDTWSIHLRNPSLGVVVHSSSYWFFCHSAIPELEAQTFHLGHAVFHKPLTGGAKKVLLWWKWSFSVGQSCQSYSCAAIKLWQHLYSLKERWHMCGNIWIKPLLCDLENLTAFGEINWFKFIFIFVKWPSLEQWRGTKEHWYVPII